MSHATSPPARLRRRATHLPAALLLGLLSAAPAFAALPPDEGMSSVRLAQPASPHWVWVNDFVFMHIPDGMAYLVDGDTGHYLGTLSTGFSFMRLNLSRDGKLIYSPETYFSRGTRGTRTDLVTLYDAATLNAVAEIPIPAKRSSNVPMMGNSELLDDDRFLLVYNFNPAASVTVVDTASRKFVTEVETPGCALIYPTGARSFFSVCGDGALLEVELDEHGAVAKQTRTEPLLDVVKDPVTEKGVRLGNTWYFVSFDGMISPLEITAHGAVPGKRWSLLSRAERAQHWRPGGLQQLAVHGSRLYALVHQGNRDTHKDPGKDLWVYDLGTHQRVQKIALKNVTGSVAVTRDAHPLLFGITMESNVLDVYDATSGAWLRAVPQIGLTPTLLVTP